MSAKNPEPVEPSENGWADLSADELDELRQAFAEADAEFLRGESIPAEEVLPRLRRAG